MDYIGNILVAKIGGDTVSILIAVVIGALFVAAKAMEKKMQKRAKEEEARRPEEDRLQGEGAQPTPTREAIPSQQVHLPGQKRYPPMPPQPAADRVAEHRPPPSPIPAQQVQPPAGMPHPQPVMQQVPQRRDEAPAPRPVRLQPAEPIPIQPEPVQHAPEDLEQEVKELQGRLPKLDQFRSQRLAATVPAESRISAWRRRPLVAREAEQPAAAMPLAGVGLRDLATARQAIVFHEIFSSPKALRLEREMWDA